MQARAVSIRMKLKTIPASIVRKLDELTATWVSKGR